MEKIKLLVSIVLYNPTDNFYANFHTLAKKDFYSKLMIVDNSNNSNEKLVRNCINNEIDINYLAYNENKGIAKALKDVMDYAKNNKYDYVLTLDQDSIFPFDKYLEIEEILLENLNKNIGIVALNYNNRYKSDSKYIYIKKIITSGNFINVKQYEQVDGFDEKLFIDYVDFDLCYQFYKKNIKLILIPSINIEHTIGDPIYKRMLFIKIKSMNHSPIRYYYRYRNELYCYKKSRRFFLKSHIKEHINILLMLIYEKNKKEKMKMIKRGKKDAKIKKFGPFTSYRN